MFHWYIPYFFCALLIGMTSLAIIAVIYARNKTDWMPYYLYFYSVFTVLMGSDLTIYYLAINLRSVYRAQLHVFLYADSCVLIPLLTLSLPMFGHALSGLPNKLQYFRTIAIVVGSEVFLQHIILFVTEDLALCEIIANAAILGMIVYCIIIGHRAYHYIQEPDRKRLVSKFVLLLGFCSFCQILDIAMSFFSSFILYPLAYCSLGVTFAHTSLRMLPGPVPTLQPRYENSLTSIPEPPSAVAQPPLPVASAVGEAEFGSYGLSEREKEILLFVLKGCSNAEIAEMARISLSTVKAHLTSIYEKIGVKNRYELISYFSNPQFPFPKTKADPRNNGDFDA